MSNQSISINTLNPVAHNNIPVLTTDLLASLYQTEVKNIQQNYKRNEDKFIEGKHFFKISGIELSNLRPSLRGLQISPKTRSLILWTERGAARHAKMLDTDQAWEVFEKLEDSYFSSSEQAALPSKTTVDQRTPLRDAVNLLVSKKALTYSEAYSVVHQRFNVTSIEDLPLEQLSQAIEYVHKVALEGEYISHQEEKVVTVQVKTLHALSYQVEKIYQIYFKHNLHEALRLLGSNIDGELCDRVRSAYAFSRIIDKDLSKCFFK